MRKAPDDAVALANLQVLAIHLIPCLQQCLDVIFRENLERRPCDTSIWGQRKGLVTGHAPISHPRSQFQNGSKVRSCVTNFKRRDLPSGSHTLHGRCRRPARVAERGAQVAAARAPGAPPQQVRDASGPHRMIRGAYGQGAAWVQPNRSQHTHTQHELPRNCASVGTGPV